MSDKISLQPQAAAMHASYPPNRAPYTTASNPYMNSQGKSDAGYGPSQLADAVAGLNVSGQYPLSTTHELKSSMSGHQSNMDLNNIPRAGYSGNPVVILPNGQTVPLSAFYGQQQNSSSDRSTQLPYLPTGMFPSFIGGPNMVPGTMSNYVWPYGVPGRLPDFDPNRRGPWPSNEENSPVTPVVGGKSYQAQYPNYACHNTTAFAVGQRYTAGPIQPMKCADNKSYEMVNLDELTQRDPPIPRAVPALWTNQDELSLAKCLQNPEGVTNVYIRGFMPDTTDDNLERWASRFGEIESCKAIIEQDTGKCKGFGFVLYYSPACAENCIRGFFHLGFQASYAQKSRNSRLKDLEDRNSTNIYCTGVPINWNELDLAKHFLPYNAISTKICRDVPSGVSKEVGFARFETREIAEHVVKDFHSVTDEPSGVKLYLRFADTKAQKQLKQQSQERRTWRSREYSYSIEHTPCPTIGRLQCLGQQISPDSYVSHQSTAGASTAFTPATSVSPPEAPSFNKAIPPHGSAWPTQGDLQCIGTTGAFRGQIPGITTRSSVIDAIPPQTSTAVSIRPEIANTSTKPKTPSPQKVSVKIEQASGKENVRVNVIPQSTC